MDLSAPSLDFGRTYDFVGTPIAAFHEYLRPDSSYQVERCVVIEPRYEACRFKRRDN